LQRLLLILAFAVSFAIGAMPQAVGLPGLDTAHAQNQQQRNRPQQRANIFDMIFGGALRRQFPRPRFPVLPDPRARRVIVAPPPGDVLAAPQAPPREEVQKSEAAAKVLVVGDFMADGVHLGLSQNYAENPNVVIVNASSGLSGIVRSDVVDWPARVPELIAEHRPVAVVVSVGMNDRQQMRLETGRVDKLTPEWRTQYEARVEAVVKTVRERGLPLFWIGLPPVNSGAMNKDYLVFNEIFRSRTEAAEGKFIDIWDGFTNAEGAFVSAGPDVNGQIVRLRNSDGINMTRAGKLKMGFYAERELRKLPGLANDGAIAALPGLDGQSRPYEPEYDPAKTGRTIVVSLDGPLIDGGDVLDGAPDGDAATVESDSGATSHELVVNGVALRPHKGRIDYEWGAPLGEEPRPVASTAAPTGPSSTPPADASAGPGITPVEAPPARPVSPGG